MPKIRFEGGPPVSDAEITINLMCARALGLKMVERVPAHARKLAIVGGSPSVVDHLEELRAFDGDIWAINGACRWLIERGIDATFISVDPHEIVIRWVGPEIRSALLCARLNPEVFRILKEAGADVRIFELYQDNAINGAHCLSSTASLGFDLATDLGYRDVTWYGCEGSYGGKMDGNNSDDRTHAYAEPSEKRSERMVIACGDGEYLTAPDFYVQSCELSDLICKFPTHFRERSGGLLRAMVAANGAHEITKVSRSLMAMLKPVDEASESAHAEMKQAAGMAEAA